MNPNGFSTPREERYLDDFVEGAVYEYGPISLTAEEIVQFGQKYDPQAFHTDPAAAQDSFYGGLIASGWQTCALFMRLFVDNYLPGKASLGSPGVDELRWLAPVKPGDELRLRITVHKVRRSKSKPDRGVLYSYCEMLNQHGQVVCTMMALNLVSYRESA